MSDFNGDVSQHKAQKPRKCIYCGQGISIGDTYKKQSGVFDGDWYTNHYHPECFDQLGIDGEDEFMPYENERPMLEAKP